MICERCKNKNAVYHFKSSFNGQHSEFHLCSECAAQLGLTTKSAGPLGGIFGVFAAQSSRDGATKHKVCQNCGTTENEVASSGYVGCAECYKTFSTLLSPYIVKLHGKTHHTGKVPLGYSKVAAEQRQRDKEIKALKTQLEDAVKAENYELAAKLRDEINALNIIKEEHIKSRSDENGEK